MTGKNALAIHLLSVMEILLSVMENEKFLQKFHRETTETRWRYCSKLKLGGETHFAGGSTFYLGGGSVSAGSLLGDVSSKNKYTAFAGKGCLDISFEP